MDKNYSYNNKKGFIAFFVLFVVLMIVAPAFSQTISSTGNLVNNTTSPTTTTSTWQNGYYVNELTCWKGGDPNCSPGTPYVRPGSNINFSYTYTELYQNLSVAKALPNSGTGLVTTGFTFSWMSKNGNGWDDGNLDQLKAYVQGYSKSGQWIENYNYDLNFKHDWTNYTWNQNWSKDRRSSELSTVIFGFAGKDNNYWVGPYGPEVTNVNFQLKYKPDPCVTNPLYSPECPKFQETLQKNLASTTTTTETIKPPPEYNSSQSQSTTQPKQSDDPMQGEKEHGVNEVDPLYVDTNRLIGTLIKIEDNQQKDQQLTQEASTTAIKETEKISQQTTRLAEQVASRAVRQSIEIGSALQQQANTEQTNKENKSQQSMSLFQAPTAITIGTFQLPNQQQQFNILQAPNNSSSSTMAASQDTTIKVQNTSVINVNLVNASQQAPISTTMTQQNITQQFQNNVTVTNPLQIASINPLVGQVQETPTQQSNFLTNKADPINSIIESKPQSEEKKQDTNIKQVKSNVQDNDAAVGVSIDSISRTPIGFNNYMIALKDAAFYAPKEIYRGQKTIDNARALRQLASDRLHQEMVDQQYRR